MSAHTPGPWTAHDLDRNGFFPYVKMQTGEAYHNRLIINAPTGTDLKPTDLEPIRANARLIAAAPELLEALKQACTRLVADNGTVAGEPYQRVIGLCKAAIDKAEGRS